MTLEKIRDVFISQYSKLIINKIIKSGDLNLTKEELKSLKITFKSDKEILEEALKNKCTGLIEDKKQN